MNSGIKIQHPKLKMKTIETALAKKPGPDDVANTKGNIGTKKKATGNKLLQTTVYLNNDSIKGMKLACALGKHKSNSDFANAAFEYYIEKLNLPKV